MLAYEDVSPCQALCALQRPTVPMPQIQPQWQGHLRAEHWHLPALQACSQELQHQRMYVAMAEQGWKRSLPACLVLTWAVSVLVQGVDEGQGGDSNGQHNQGRDHSPDDLQGCVVCAGM